MTLPILIADQAFGYRGMNTLLGYIRSVYTAFVVEHRWFDARHARPGAWAYAKIAPTGAGDYTPIIESSRNCSSVSRIAAGQYRIVWSIQHPGPIGVAIVTPAKNTALEIYVTTNHCGTYTDVFMKSKTTALETTDSKFVCVIFRA
jgi:hypothetical protein